MVIDCTTTARRDRIKSKLWDAYWLKKLWKYRNTTCIVIIENDTNKEKGHFRRAKALVKECSNKYKMVDYILTINQFDEILGEL